MNVSGRNNLFFDMCNVVTPVPIIGVIPTFVTLGPLALLSLLFPALAGVLAVAMRRWLALFSVLSLNSTLYILHAWFRGYLSGTILGGPTAIWTIMIGVTILGGAWASLRRRFRGGWSEFVSLAGLAVLTTVGLGRTIPKEAPAGVDVVWMFEARERGAIVATPAIAGDRIFLGIVHDTPLKSRGAVYCLDRDTRQVIWTFDDGGKMQPMYSSPCLAAGRVYIGEGMHGNYVCKFYCLDASTGRKLWDSKTTDHIESTPCVADTRVFFGAGDDGMYCLDAESGRQIWHFRRDLHIDASPTVVGNRVYCGSGTSRLNKTTEFFCLDAATGAVIWQRMTDLPVWSAPIVSDGGIYVALGNGRVDQSARPPEKPAGEVLCVDEKTQQQRWRFDLGDGVLASCAVDSAGVFFGSRDGFIYALDRETGLLEWRSDLGSPVVTRPALSGDSLYVVSSAGSVVCLKSESGAALWSFDMARRSQMTPRSYSSPCALDSPDESGHRRIFVGTELRNPVSSAAVLFQLRD
jgi:outer membrane protein assembly factor BamB